MKRTPIFLFGSVAGVIVFGVFLIKLLDQIVVNIGNSWTEMHTNIVLLFVLSLIAIPVLSSFGNSGSQKRTGENYTMLPDRQPPPQQYMITDTQPNRLPTPQYNDNYFGETVDL